MLSPFSEETKRAIDLFTIIYTSLDTALVSHTIK